MINQIEPAATKPTGPIKFHTSMPDNIVSFGNQPPAPENQQPANASWTKRRRMLKDLLAESALTQEDIRTESALVFSQALPLPPNGLPFEKAVLYVTAAANRNVKAAYKRFCAYHVDVFGWDPSRHHIGPGAPGKHWSYWDLVNHRLVFTLWRVKKAQASQQQTAANLRKSSKREKTA